MADKQNRILSLKRFLEEQSDEAHPVTMTAILAHLSATGIPASRKTVVNDIKELIAFGVDVVCNPGNPIEYFIGDNHFELPELKLLVDAVRASRFIPQRKADSMIEKLMQLTSIHQAKELWRTLYTDKQVRSTCDKAYITVDLLHEAVRTGKKITCRYFDWSAAKKKVYKHKRQEYRFSPYGLVWNNDRYYSIGWSDNHGKIISLRVDRIATPRLTEESAALKPDGFDMAFYTDSVIQMYDGPVRDITLTCDNDMMKHVIDRFGEGVKTEIIDAEHFAAFVRIPASPTFFAWLFTFGGAIRITAPRDAEKEYKKLAQAILNS